MAFDFYVHGLWVLGTIFLFIGALFAGNLQWVRGTTEASFTISAVLTLLLLLIGGMMWISAAVNARQEERP